MKSFAELGLPEFLSHTLNHLKFNTPTQIQSTSIPLAMEGKDILGSAQTGTGKTAAFAIPLIVNLHNKPNSTALVMTPTRELASQVMGQFSSLLGKKTRTRSALLIGGDSMFKQLNQLKNKPRLIVGTPGRINDHLKRGSLKLDSLDFLVLDETDRMLDMGFSVQINEILKYAPAKRQTLLFSATLPPNIIKLSKQYMSDPVRVEADKLSEVPLNIKQQVIYTGTDKKYDYLKSQIDKRSGSIIVFAKTKLNTENLVKKLSKDGFDAFSINGDLRQNVRARVINNFRKMKFRILVATDVASRGIDVPHIEHVINYNIPENPDDYIHRIGRTARAGANGAAVIFITPSERQKWNRIKSFLKLDIEEVGIKEETEETNKKSRKGFTNKKNKIRFFSKQNKKRPKKRNGKKSKNK
ncbi:MAG: DEAD/DEAH box helicase [Hyphomicrobiales bacterium]